MSVLLGYGPFMSLESVRSTKASFQSLNRRDLQLQEMIWSSTEPLKHSDTSDIEIPSWVRL